MLNYLDLREVSKIQGQYYITRAFVSYTPKLE
jgi:hypothetical protein